MFRIIRPDDVPATEMEARHRAQAAPVGASIGATAIDRHIDRLRLGGGPPHDPMSMARNSSATPSNLPRN